MTKMVKIGLVVAVIIIAGFVFTQMSTPKAESNCTDCNVSIEANVTDINTTDVNETNVSK